MKVYVNQVEGGCVMSIVSGRNVLVSRNYFDWTADQVWDYILLDCGGESNYIETMLELYAE
jgi:hypothetical protein